MSRSRFRQELCSSFSLAEPFRFGAQLQLPGLSSSLIPNPYPYDWRF